MCVPEILENRKLPNGPRDEQFWQRRFEDIRSLESHLHRSGTLILKFFLNLSKEEQKARFLKRLHNPEKHWKYNPRDLAERELWDQYQWAYSEALLNTHSDDAPWFVIPADHKLTMQNLIAEIVVGELLKLDLRFPDPDPRSCAPHRRSPRGAWAINHRGRPAPPG